MGIEQMLEGKLATSMLGKFLPSRGDSTNAQSPSKKPLCGVGVVSIRVSRSCSSFVCSYRGHSRDSSFTPNTARTMCYCQRYNMLLFLSPTKKKKNARKMDGAHGSKEVLLLLRCLPQKSEGQLSDIIDKRLYLGLSSHKAAMKPITLLTHQQA